GDEIVGFDGFRVGDERALGDRLSARRPGATARLLAFRRDEEVHLDVVLGERPGAWEIVADPSADEGAKRLGPAWLGEEGSVRGAFIVMLVLVACDKSTSAPPPNAQQATKGLPPIGQGPATPPPTAGAPAVPPGHPPVAGHGAAPGPAAGGG